MIFESSAHLKAASSFFITILDRGIEGLDDLVGYYDAYRAAMQESGLFDEGEATTEAAVTACSGLARALKRFGNPYRLNTVDALDRFIRAYHQIKDTIMPRTHEDPLVQAFYTELEPHLLHAAPGDRVDVWQR